MWSGMSIYNEEVEVEVEVEEIMEQEQGVWTDSNRRIKHVVGDLALKEIQRD